MFFSEQKIDPDVVNPEVIRELVRSISYRLVAQITAEPSLENIQDWVSGARQPTAEQYLRITVALEHFLLSNCRMWRRGGSRLDARRKQSRAYADTRNPTWALRSGKGIRRCHDQ